MACGSTEHTPGPNERKRQAPTDNTREQTWAKNNHQSKKSPIIKLNQVRKFSTLYISATSTIYPKEMDNLF